MPDNTANVENTTGGFGSLYVVVFFSGLSTPAEGVTVRIIDPNTNAILEEFLTNVQGQIPIVPLPTPPLEYSLSPNMPRPFNQYNVTASFEGYPEALMRNIQVFPSSTSIQFIALTSTFTNIINPYPTLWGDYPAKIPESEIKPIPFANGNIVGVEPTVPSTMVVHNGVPQDISTPNYIVTYKHYIKNVAASEIYPNWPREALKAIILAITSFTLNRVYTEWYRGKGYDFTITNSTAYDQAFTYFRNTFKVSSQVVNENFTTYITRANIRQPLFTQYSDGIRINRNGWLSKWGAKELAEKGYTALQILQNYYGDDIILKQAKELEEVTVPFKEVLKIGSTGNDVRNIQNQLNVISNVFTLIPKVIADGVYTESTADAVKAFQEVFSLPMTGEVDFGTWYRMSDIFVTISKRV